MSGDASPSHGTAPASPAGGGPDARHFHELLRALRAGGGESPPFDPSGAPDEPLPLFHRWFHEAVGAGVPEPHTMALATADAEGRPSVRTVMLHDADERGWHFATHRTSRKGRELAHRPYAALGFYWAAAGRQVRVAGPVRAADPAESAADLRERSPAARVAALVGRQSEVLGSYPELVRAFEEAGERIAREPDAVAPGWTRYVLEPEEVEFYQGDPDRRHVRLRYLRERAAAVPGAGDAAGPSHAPAGAVWRRELLWP
ncbi:pyridoxal 5'-phosphate synthase [Streptomyces pactum]|uniref:Pyridoxal 5'-phosphate synthase n=1 Tax=Streptomyces pactum TaxID=68249 RepID=A0ABS0NJD2_9ACTN|nr:pyridoxal 5'-phosphate synthase [Streptomyces pactum]MBH5335307.1 pyridoxal 5'-phosphate synthase [Streptomyces pactum]